MKKIMVRLAVLTLGFLLATMASCQKSPAAGTYRRISPEDAKELLAKDSRAILLDVRTPAENLEARIDGSRLLPYDEIVARLAELPPDKSVPIIVYCRTGNRSAKAAQTLLKAGYTEVFDLGGIQQWPYGTISG